MTDAAFLDQLDPAWVSALSQAMIVLLLLILTLAVLGLSGQVKRTARHLTQAQEDRRRQDSLSAVRRYETDPQLREAIRALWEKTDQGSDYTRLEDSDRFHVITLLNTLTGSPVASNRAC